MKVKVKAVTTTGMTPGRNVLVASPRMDDNNEYCCQRILILLCSLTVAGDI